MNIRRTVALFFLSLSSVFLFGESQKLTVTVPQITKMARITAERVNLRQNPSALSAALVDEMDEELSGSDEIPVTVWSTSPKPKGYERTNCQLYKDLYVPVINESNGWYQTIVTNDFHGTVHYPWFKGDFATLEDSGLYFPEEGFKNPYESISIRDNGRFKGFTAFGFGSEPYICGVRFGRLIDDVLIVPLQLECYLNYRPDIKGILIEKENSFNATQISYGQDVAKTNEYGVEYLCFEKLSDNQFAELLRLSKDINPYFYYQTEIPFVMGSQMLNDFYISADYPGEVKKIDITIPPVDIAPAARPRDLSRPSCSYINEGSVLEKVSLQRDGTTITMSFINRNGLRQWNVNRDAYITCDATPGKRYYLLRTQGVNISPRPTVLSGNRNEKVVFSMTFEAVPLSATRITLVEGPSRDNFHVNEINVSD